MEQNDYIEIDVRELFRKLLASWKTLALWVVIAALIGLAIGFSIPKQYKSVSMMAPEVASKSAGGSLGSLASLAGLNLSSMGSSDAVYPELYPQIVSSNPFIVDLLPLEVSFRTGKGTMGSADLYTYMDEYQKEPWWTKAVKAPINLARKIMQKSGEGTAAGEEAAPIDPRRLTKEQEDVVKAVRESISLSVDKKTSVITLAITAQDPYVAAAISEEVIRKLTEYVTSYRTEKSRNDLEYYQQLYDEAQADYYDAQKRYARYVDAHQSVILQSVRTEQERLQNEMELKFQLYNSCAQQLQLAKAKVQQETPVCTIIDPPSVPLKRSKPSKAMLTVVFGFLGGVAGIIYILMIKGKREEEGEGGENAQAQ